MYFDGFGGKFLCRGPETLAVIVKFSDLVLGKKQAKNNMANVSDAVMLLSGRSAKMDIKYERELQWHFFV